MNKTVKNLISIVLGALCGYLIYYYVIMDVVSVMYGSGGKMYHIISIVLLLLSILCCCMIASFIFNRRINHKLLILISVCYFLLLFFTLFCRTAVSREFILNPLDSIKDLKNWRMIFQTFLNLAMFVPLGCYFRKIKSIKKVVIIAACISFSIELIQGITQRGFFDTFDIIIYCLGIVIGYRLSLEYQKINKKIK